MGDMDGGIGDDLGGELEKFCVVLFLGFFKFENVIEVWWVVYFKIISVMNGCV